MEAPTFPEIYGDLPDHKIIEDPQSRMRSWKREKALRSRQNNQVAAADALRKAQIKNANQHYEYEVRRAEAQYCEDLVDCDAISIMKAPRVEKSMLTARSSSILASSFARSAATSEIPVLKLDDKLISEDLSAVAQHCQLLSRKLLNSVPQEVAVAVMVMAESPQLRIGSQTFSTGDMVVCFSTLSQESFHGMISDITPTAVSLICGNSARFFFSINQIQEGRVLISSDTESIENLHTLNKYSQLLTH